MAREGLGAAPAALGQSSADKAAAEALFQAGRDLMTQGKYDEACAKFEGSQKLDAVLDGVGLARALKRTITVNSSARTNKVITVITTSRKP